MLSRISNPATCALRAPLKIWFAMSRATHLASWYLDLIQHISRIHLPLMIALSQDKIDEFNESLKNSSASEILAWASSTFPNLYQTTAFGLTGLVIMDIMSKTNPVDLIFIDTLHHFPQTYDLVDKIKQKYHPKLHIYKPEGTESDVEFVQKHGDNLWEKDDSLYDFLVKVEPAQRAYKELGVEAVLTGRRKTQGGARAVLPVVEVEASSGIVKINPLRDWDFAMVQEYIKKNNVPYNELLDLGYKSIGDWHSTVPVAEGEDERSGRWKGQAKTECGIHETSRFGEYLKSGGVTS